MTPTIAFNLLDFARKLFDFGNSIRQAKLEEKQRISNFLKQVATALEQMVAKFEKGEDANEQCGELKVYMDFLMKALEKHIPKETIDALEVQLNTASLARGLAVEVHSDRDQTFKNIRESIGQFRALSNVILL